ncbi:MAG TPA: glycerol-3-phosphate acyltransferase [Candidatus Kapabacteria bacterium]|nr:glycerol-3-phosphate acyltransferase [Candidatus Kapabacteria bacterium]
MDALQQPIWQNLFAILAGYLIGSIPFAYIFAKWRTGKDLRNEGSGNIGTLNSYEVTGSRTVGVLTLIFDVLKGVVPTWLAMLYFSDAVVLPLAVALVVGHCFPIWLKFKGGRGLATAAGITLAVNWLLLPLWLLGFGIGVLMKRQVHVGAVSACIFTAVSLMVIPYNLLNWFSVLDVPVNEIRNGAWLILFVILLRHIEPMMALRDQPTE